MPRLGALFIAVCMVLIAASLGTVLYLLLGLGVTEAGFLALGVLVALVFYNTMSARLRDRAELGAQIADLSRGTADLSRQVAELARRTTAIEGQGDKIADNAAERTRAVTEPITVELGELGTLVKHLAETVAVLEVKLTNVKTQAGSADRAPAAPPVMTEPAGISELVEPERKPARPRAAPKSNKDETARAVRNALEANRVELHLQPIVTLPQRKVRFYEAFTRLRNEDDALITPTEFLDAAESAGLMQRIDQLLLNRCVQVVRRLQLKNRDIGLFCNIAGATLNDARLFPQILQFMDANRALAPSLVLEFRQSTLRAMGPLETESLVALRELGFRFCMDNLTDLRMEPRDLIERGIRYVKVPAQMLLGEAAAPGVDIHAADLSDLLGRHGISLIAERIETEVQVVNLLDYDVRFGQGFLFSPPRPVRPDALQNLAEGSARAQPNAKAGAAF
ncbi:MAG: EAL domain-containing protein [Alphaproteobacteria bacterium]|nr:EAL domain-containing protein [Alphaproteobacteria bacterium]